MIGLLSLSYFFYVLSSLLFIYDNNNLGTKFIKNKINDTEKNEKFYWTIVPCAVSQQQVDAKPWHGHPLVHDGDAKLGKRAYTPLAVSEQDSSVHVVECNKHP